MTVPLIWALHVLATPDSCKQTGEQWDGVVSGNGGQVIGFVTFNNLNLGVPVFAYGVR